MQRWDGSMLFLHHRMSIRGLAPVSAMLIGIMVGCSSPVDEPLPTKTSMIPTLTPTAIEPQPIMTAAATEPITEPPPTVTVTAFPTPALSEALIGDDFLFEPSSVSGCQLPCWQGLRVGQSGRADIQRVFDEVFGFHGHRQFIPDEPPVPTSLPFEFYAAGYIWNSHNSEDEIESFVFNTFYERATFALRALEFAASYERFNVHLLPYRIMEELGQPSHMLMGFVGGERADAVNFWMDIVYAEIGMVFHFSNIFLPGSIGLYPDHIEAELDLCLDNESWSTEYVDYRQVLILNPLPENLDEMSSLQSYLLPYETAEPIFSVPDFFKVSLEDITVMALQGSEDCLTGEFYEEH